MLTNILEINDINFDQMILKNTKPVILDFWAEWCNPCKIFLPILEKIAIKYKDVLIVSKINIDKFNNLAVKYSIQSIPTLLFFKDSKLIAKKTGIISQNAIQKLISLYFDII